ncbi:unnamed protein product [Enterobius vermicularis]|uniref:Uncharacterized protein n=1 Tax=Enterobius vermicularis TaxID=51028 RepID=A0A0N4V8J2_ENTVE|nr:unnamed protein product [Enterobius vermicularis]
MVLPFNCLRHKIGACCNYEKKKNRTENFQYDDADDADDDDDDDDDDDEDADDDANDDMTCKLKVRKRMEKPK